VSIADGRVYLKAEHLQKTGSFKARATSNRVAVLTPEEARRGIVTVSAGNAAQAYAWAGRDRGVPVTVVMTSSAAPERVAATRGYGAEVITAGPDVASAFDRMEELRAERGLTLCHPFDDPDVIAGDGTVGLELLDELPDVDVVVVAIGGGGLISGVATALKERHPAVRVYGVEPTRSDAMARALREGRPVRIAPDSVADSLGSPYAGEWTLPVCARYLDGVILVDDPEILGGVAFALGRLKQVLEPAGAAALAALLYGRVPLRSGDRVAAVLCGGNTDLARLAEMVAGAAPLSVPDGE
jgi:threonine dehydratase